MIWTCGGYLVRQHNVAMAGESAVLTTQRTIDFRTVAGLADDQREWFYSCDEVKPVTHAGKPLVLVTASWRGAVAVVDPEEPRVLFCAPLPDAHSAEMLADGSVVAAASDEMHKLVWYRRGEGMSLVEAAQLHLPHGHGVVRDLRMECLWVAGARKLLRMPLPTDGKWEPAEVIDLPDDNAHDLSPDPVTGRLIITTGEGVWRYCPETGQFTPFDDLQNTAKVKCVSVDPVHGRLVVVADSGHWWSDGINWTRGEGVGEGMGERTVRLSVPDIRLYKARWDRPQQRI